MNEYDSNRIYDFAKYNYKTEKIDELIVMF